MKYKTNLSKTIPLLIGVLTLTFLIVFLVSAWTEPTTSPPSGNVDAPINTGSTAQTKTGDFNIGGGLEYWITKIGDSFALKNDTGTIQFVLGQDGVLSMNNNTITGLANPTATSSAVNYETMQSALAETGGGIPLIVDQTLYSFPETSNLGSGGTSGYTGAWREIKSYPQDLSGAGEDVNLIFIDSFRCRGTYNTNLAGYNTWIQCCMFLSAGSFCNQASTRSTTPVSFDITTSVGKQIAISDFEKYMYMKNFGEIRMNISAMAGCGGCSMSLNESYLTLKYRKTNQ